MDSLLQTGKKEIQILSDLYDDVTLHSLGLGTFMLSLLALLSWMSATFVVEAMSIANAVLKTGSKSVGTVMLTVARLAMQLTLWFLDQINTQKKLYLI